MQNQNRQNLTRSNYTPSPKERHLVHYKVEFIKCDPRTGQRLSHPEIVKTGVKFFPNVKKELEKLGNSVEVLYHPQHIYNTPINVPVNLSEEKKALESELEKKDMELQEKARKLEDADRRLAEMEARMKEFEKRLASESGNEKPLSNIEKARAAKEAKKKEAEKENQ